MRVLRELIVPGRRPMADGSWGENSVLPVELPSDTSISNPVGATYDPGREVWRVLVIQYVDDGSE